MGSNGIGGTKVLQQSGSKGNLGEIQGGQGQQFQEEELVS